MSRIVFIDDKQVHAYVVLEIEWFDVNFLWSMAG